MSISISMTLCFLIKIAKGGTRRQLVGTMHSSRSRYYLPVSTTPRLSLSSPDLVRQVLATATISYEDLSAPSYAKCSFSFMADGEYCSLSLDKLNEIYEIANEPRGVAVAKKFAPSNTFWELIPTGNITPDMAYQSQIRNPALRVNAKIISNLLYAKDQTSKVTNGELQTMYAGIEDE
ncbi:hypothetical protein DY000_02006465 [Brassica cretica]|uniref:Arabidopsis retrotransposon Orf1 C-terminal domain-containing protein n=1 Tax=Brassica cretica TaxID=69181 RepID=A0ABQ7C628_BRACR|nr:hypothetical protein DY000_02006465 [Brassica cretica]